jgi:hypothetical protein
VRRSRIREEELQKILANADLDDTKKAEAIKSYVGNNFVPTSKYSDKVKEVETITTEKNNLSTEFDKFKQEKMTEEEKKTEQARKEAEANEKMMLEFSRMKAENIFAKAGFKEEDYGSILDSIVGTDLEKTKTLAETFCNTLVKQKADIEKQVKDKIVQGTKNPPAGNDNGGNDSDLDKYKKLYAEAVAKNDFVNMSYYTRLIQETLQKEN